MKLFCGETEDEDDYEGKGCNFIYIWSWGVVGGV